MINPAHESAKAYRDRMNEPWEWEPYEDDSLAHKAEPPVMVYMMLTQEPPVQWQIGDKAFLVFRRDL